MAAARRHHADGSFAAAIAALLYANTVRNGFAFDDHRAIERNGVVSGAVGIWPAVLTHDFWGTPLSSPSSHRSYRPLSTLTLWLNARADPSGGAAFYHAANALLHALTTWVLWYHATTGLRRRPAVKGPRTVPCRRRN